MKTKTILTSLGATVAASILTTGIVVVGALAQTPSAAPAQSTPSAANTPAAQATANPSDGPKSGMQGFGGGHERGHGGFGDFDGMGPYGAGLTADSAQREITQTTDFLTNAKGDLAYATGKMDTANVEKWLNQADTLLKEAQTAVTNTKYEQAAQQAQAAMGLTMAAETTMGQTLGYDKLPSATLQPQGRNGHMGHLPGGYDNANVTLTQVQASRVLAQTYNHLAAQKAVTGSSEAAAYLTEAQSAYATAYANYNAGKYNEAASSARLAEQLAGVARHVQAAADAPANADTPVTVPAPNF